MNRAVVTFCRNLATAKLWVSGFEAIRSRPDTGFTELLPMAARPSSPRAEMAFRRHAPPAPVPVLRISGFNLMTRVAAVPRAPAAPEQPAIHRDARRIGKSVGPLRSAVSPRDDDRPGFAAGDTRWRPSCAPAGAQDAQSSPSADRSPNPIVDRRTLGQLHRHARTDNAAQRHHLSVRFSYSAPSRAVPRAPRPSRPRHGCPAAGPSGSRANRTLVGQRVETSLVL